MPLFNGLLPITGCSWSRQVRGSPIALTLIWFSAISFILFGFGCFVSPAMRREYERYGLPGFRIFAGTLQLLGAIGLLVGFDAPLVGQLASGGLALLMLCGVGVRIKIKDNALNTLPAFAYMVLNSYLALAVY